MEEKSSESFTVEQLKAGEKQAWDVAFKSFRILALDNLAQFENSLPFHDREEIAREAILRLKEKYLENINGAASQRELNVEDLKRLLITIATNEAKDTIASNRALKRGGNKVDSLEGLAEGIEFKSDDKDPSERLQAEERTKEQLSLIKRAIKRLPKKHAQVLVDLYWHGRKHEEIAKRRGLKVGSIGVYRKRALEVMALLVAGTITMLLISLNWAVWFGPDVKIAMLDSNSGASGAVEVDAGAKPMAMLNNNQMMEHSLKIANEFKRNLGPASYMLYSNSAELLQWSDKWASDQGKRHFKVVYDMGTKTVRLLGYWDGKIQIDERFAVTNEQDLPDVLKSVHERIIQAGKK